MQRLLALLLHKQWALWERVISAISFLWNFPWSFLKQFVQKALVARFCSFSYNWWKWQIFTRGFSISFPSTSHLPSGFYVMGDHIFITNWCGTLKKSVTCFLTVGYLWYENILVPKGRKLTIPAVCNVSLEPALFAKGKYLSLAFIWVPLWCTYF